ncbi:NAD-dependent epimerase/dehydratase family protein [Aureimonas sp. AU4]|uniref:NAD-dependent epimerase/dehydratase family protein n=1 Tax=Aureimonas sp. AU4 TaxID=1638163 RepID=UPI000786563B|nr:NAD-dependent epimerase/dehydratase family protein [Aureimonas sp. AU4]
MERTALVLGASGGIGGAVARRLLASGWTVRALAREGSMARLPAGVAPVAGDAMDARAVLQAARGAALVVHAVNPPGYRDWDRLVLPMLDNTVAAARANGARILLPGTVYNYGPDAFPLIGEDAPQNPATRKGRIRAEMERRLREAAQTGETQVLVVRAGDFFGPQAGNSWFAQGLVPPGRRPRAIRNPAARGVGHQWAYLPDVAETMVRLVERGELGGFERFHMEGHWDADGTRMTGAIVEALGSPAVPVRPLPWWALRLAAPFNETVRELLEMRYLWRRPVRMTNARLVARLGEEPRTPLAEAVRATLAANRCLA